MDVDRRGSAKELLQVTVKQDSYKERVIMLSFSMSMCDSKSALSKEV